MDEPWILEDFATALVRLEEALAVPPTTDLLKAGSIQYFEFCFELAWKAIKIQTETLGLPSCLSPKACLKVAFAQGWIEDEPVWLAMLEARNRMSHTYNAASALGVYDRLADFARVMRTLHHRLRDMS